MTDPYPGEGARHDFIIVGSGAGGGPFAAKLIEAGFSVLLIEAGSDHRCPYYDVPIMQARPSEDAEMRWDFFVRHYGDDALQRRSDKFVAERDGVLYPRGATLGGSTAISALSRPQGHPRSSQGRCRPGAGDARQLRRQGDHAADAAQVRRNRPRPYPAGRRRLSPRSSSSACTAGRGRRRRSADHGIEVPAATDACGGKWRKLSAHSGREVAGHDR